MKRNCPTCNNGAPVGECERCDKKEENMNRPEEKKNDLIVKKIPDKLLNPINEAQKIKGQLTLQFFQIALQRANMENKYQEIFGKLTSTGTSIGNKIKRAFDKMKLGKRKEIRWSYNPNEGAFIGIPQSTPKAKNEQSK